MIDAQQDDTSSDDGEPDMEPSESDEPIKQPQKISPRTASETAASLGLLGAGRPYRNMNK